jgi:hypothetical protein
VLHVILLLLFSQSLDKQPLQQIIPMYSVNKKRLQKEKLPMYDSFFKETMLVPLPQTPIPYTEKTKIWGRKGISP